MTDDLVKCLRNRANGIMQWVTVERMATEAADRIEALEKALDILQAAMVAKKPIPMPFKIAMNKASAALAGEKQD